MHIDSLYVYPIKSLRGIPLPSSPISSLGLSYDRIFLLQRVLEPEVPRKNLHIGHLDELCLFTPSFLPPPSSSSPSAAESLLIRYTPPPAGVNGRPISATPHEIMIPLRPSIDSLEKVEVVMHRSSCDGWDMGTLYSDFFTKCLGFPARLVFLGGNRRKVLGNVAPPATLTQASSLLGSLSNMVSGILPSTPKETARGAEISFADCAPLLVTTVPSLKAVEAMVPEDGRDGVDITKFRPNILVKSEEGEELQPWEEDFWAELEVESGAGSAKVVLTANCARCKSINVDYTTGLQPPPARQTLKAMMKDRRVDEGMKYSPVFGRYGYLDSPTPLTVSVGDRVTIGRKNSERGVFYWPGLSVGTRN